MNKRRYHTSWLIALGSLGFLLGAAVSPHLYEKFMGLHWLIAGLCLCLIALNNGRTLSLIVVLAAGVSIGLWRGAQLAVGFADYETWHGKTITVTGRVAEDPDTSTSGDIQLKLKGIEIESQFLPGQIWLSSSGEIDIRRSDSITVRGRLVEGFGNFPAAMYRAQIESVERQDFSDVGRDVRDSFAGGVRSAIKEPEASLANGFLVGQKSNLPEKLDNNLKLLGLTHIIVASGYNLTILVRFARRLFEKISRFTALAASGFLIFAFMQITGFSPSMNRAALVTGLSLAAWYFGRKLHPFVLLLFAAAITVVINPAYVWGDLGWLLSFMAFIGVIVLSPLLHSYFWGEKKPGAVRQVVLETLSAQMATLPIIAYAFGQYSPLSLFANMLILPLIPLVMVFTFFAGLVGLVSPSLAQIVGFPAQSLLGYMTTLVDWFAVWPIASRELEFSKTMLAVSYIVLFWLIIFFWARSGHMFREHNVIE